MNSLRKYTNLYLLLLVIFVEVSNITRGIVVTTGIKPSSNIGSALVSAMYGRSSELGLYQTYTSAHPFDTLVSGLGGGAELIYARPAVAEFFLAA